jgi:hypothetical protein
VYVIVGQGVTPSGRATSRVYDRQGLPSYHLQFDKSLAVRLTGRTLLMKGTFNVKNCPVAHCAAMRLSIWRSSLGNVEETF